jgi:hypothetical protein
MTRAWRLGLGRTLAVVQAGVWVVILSRTPLSLGWAFGLLALAAAIVARQFPNRSALLLLAPAGVLALVWTVSLSRLSRPPQPLEIGQTAALVLPAILGAILVWTSPAAGVQRAAVPHDERSISIRSGVLAAVALAALSIVPVALSLDMPPSADRLANRGFASGPIDWRPIGSSDAVLLSTLVVLIASLIGGTVGTLIWRKSRPAGGVSALASAWATAIVAMPPAAAALGIHLRTGIVCIMGCEALLRDDQPLGGITAYTEFLMGTAIVVSPIIALGAIAAVVWAAASVRRRSLAEEADDAMRTDASPPRPRRRRLVLGSMILGFAVVHGAGIGLTASSDQTGLIPYLCLTAGAIAWALWLDHRSSRGSTAGAHPDDIPGSLGRMHDLSAPKDAT